MSCRQRPPPLTVTVYTDVLGARWVYVEGDATARLGPFAHIQACSVGFQAFAIERGFNPDFIDLLIVTAKIEVPS